MFGENLKRVMKEKGYSLTKLSEMSGIGKSSISQYISGKNVCPAERVKILADTLEVDVEILADLPTNEPVKKIIGVNEVECFNVPVELAAKLMHKKNNFVYLGLQQGVFPWGYAVQTSSQWSYYISSVKFTECTGIPVNASMAM